MWQVQIKSKATGNVKYTVEQNWDELVKSNEPLKPFKGNCFEGYLKRKIL